MIVTHDIGVIGEDAAVEYLQKKKYIILERNWHWHHFEVDIIACNKTHIAFVEVKTRSSLFGDKRPEEYVDDDKKRRVAQCADIYVRMNHILSSPRFDIIAVLLHKETYKPIDITHLEDAYDVPMRQSYHSSRSSYHRRRL